MNKTNKMVMPALISNIFLFILTIIGVYAEADWFFVFLGIVLFGSFLINIIALYKEYNG